jgi:hypothetical protein
MHFVASSISSSLIFSSHKALKRAQAFRIVLEPEDLPLKTDDISWRLERRDFAAAGHTRVPSEPVFVNTLLFDRLRSDNGQYASPTGKELISAVGQWDGLPFEIMMLITILSFWDNVLSIIILPYVSSFELGSFLDG